MPRAEVGSTKYVANQMKSKGLQRLRWYCQACQRQMRDENGFKCHVASESHVRNMMIIGEDPRKAINEYSNQFKRDFLQLLRTGHGEKKVNVNHFYNEYISNKQHIHMNATKWASLTEFAKHLGREGICRVEEDEKNSERGGASALTISWIDNSPEALRRQEALRKRERQDRGDEEREQRMIKEQIQRARQDAVYTQDDPEVETTEDTTSAEEGVKRKDGEKIVLTFGSKPTSEPEKPPSPPLTDERASPGKEDSSHHKPASPSADSDAASKLSAGTAAAPTTATTTTKSVFKSISIINPSKPKNVFAAAAKKNAFGAAKKPAFPAASKPMSEAERIMKQELERKRMREESGGGFPKKQRVK